jgi:hypothetical protein
MPLTWKTHTLFMQWCLDCHRAPEKQIRPREEVYNMDYIQPANQVEVGLELMRSYDVKTEQLTDCSICHR